MTAWQGRTLRRRRARQVAVVLILCSLAINSGASGIIGGAPRSESSASDAKSGSAGHVTEPPLVAAIRIDVEKRLRTIPLTMFGTNVEWRWNGNFLWDEASNRADSELVRLTRELGITLIRYPGGVYSDLYHWKDGIGPMEQRPIVKHEPGREDRSRPVFGTNEALRFAGQVGAELMITVNAGTGTAEEAAEWVRYVNRDSMRVRLWEVGNELYIDDGTVLASAISIDAETYVQRFLEFAAAMRTADPRIRIGAIGGANQGRYALMRDSDWTGTLLRQAGHAIDFLSVHNAYAPIATTDTADLRTVYRAMFAAPVLLRRNLQELSRQIAENAPDFHDRITIAITEWGPFFQTDWASRYIDHNKTLGSAVFAASQFAAMLSFDRVEIANFWLLNDVSVLGWIGSTSSTFPAEPAWAPTARYYALQLFSRHFGSELVGSSVSAPSYDAEAFGFIDAVRDVPWLDVVASTTPDRQVLSIIAINKHLDTSIEATISIDGFPPAQLGTARTLTGRSIDANTGTRIVAVPGLRPARQAQSVRNPRFDRGGPGEVQVVAAPVSLGAELTWTLPPLSVTAFELPRAEPGDTIR